MRHRGVVDLGDDGGREWTQRWIKANLGLGTCRVNETGTGQAITRAQRRVEELSGPAFLARTAQSGSNSTPGTNTTHSLCQFNSNREGG